MKTIFYLFLFVLCLHQCYAQQNEQYSRVKIFLDGKSHSMKTLSKLGVATDHGDYGKTYFVSDFSATEIQAIKNAGFKIQVQISDVIKHYQEQNKYPKNKAQQRLTSQPCDTANMPPINVPAHFHLGSYAGFFTYNEMLDILDSMHTLYPNLISVRQPIDTFHSIEGRQIFWLRVSNNPSVSQPAKPQMLYTALHHAREPGSLSSTIFYLWYLLENYNTNAQIKAIVDHTELYFVPCVNPDGYLYNITTNPNGGGMWRKNRRDNLDNTYGVDLNRNYGAFWGYNNIGSSNLTSSDTYRGTAGFSEPETQAIKWFAENHNFLLNLNYHTYNNDILYPLGYLPIIYTPDSLQFNAYSIFQTQNNFYRYGTCDQTLNYVANGDSDDWMYSDTTTKNKVYAWTPEIGDVQNGFYPPAYQIIPDCQNNVMTNLNTAALLLPYVSINTADPIILTQTSGYLHYNLQRLGLPNMDTFTVSIQSLDTRLTIASSPRSYTNPALLQSITDSMGYTLNATTPNGQAIKYALKIYNGYYYIADTVQFYYGKYHQVITPSTKTLTDWVDAGWGISNTVYHTSPASIKSSPTGVGNYPDNSDLTISLKNVVDLTHSQHAYLQFYTKWDIEPKFDYVMVEASAVGSSSWVPLCGKYTKPGYYSQPQDYPIYDDHEYNWVLEQVDLGAYLGQKIYLQFELVSDPGGNYDGYYFDDLKIVTVEDSTTTGIKCLSAPYGISVYPNPARNSITINVNGIALPLHAALCDLLGREVKTFDLVRTGTTIDVSQLPANMYFLKVSGKGFALPVQKVQLLK